MNIYFPEPAHLSEGKKKKICFLSEKELPLIFAVLKILKC